MRNGKGVKRREEGKTPRWRGQLRSSPEEKKQTTMLKELIVTSQNRKRNWKKYTHSRYTFATFETISTLQGTAQRKGGKRRRFPGGRRE